MNRLSPDGRAKVLQLLCEGMAIRAVSRVTGVQKNTVIKLLNDAGRTLGIYQDEAFRNLGYKRVQVDEIWSFTYCKQRAVAEAKAAPMDAGDAWTSTPIDADTNFVRIHKTLRMTPAMAAGVTDRLWEMADLVSVVEAADAKPSRPASYKKRVAA
jgi:hypothetical protein